MGGWRRWLARLMREQLLLTATQETKPQVDDGEDDELEGEIESWK